MAVHLTVARPDDLHAVAGLQIGVTEAGVRKANRKDLTVITLDEGACVGAVFTQNRFAQRLCNSASNIWRRVQAYAHWSSTPAWPTRARVKMA